MKIIESLPWANEQRPQQNKSSHADFARWIDAGVAMNPTKQNSGDEYYWQHQDQLQQSSLHFDAKPIENHQREYAVNNDGKPAFTTPFQQGSEEHASPYSACLDLVQNSKATSSCTENATTLLTELEHIIERSLLSDATKSNQFKTEDIQSKTLKVPNAPLNAPIHFKNNHLFVEGKQAELTLNLSHFNKEEQKELMQIIQDYLKKKGLVLSRLIINGVNND